MNGVGGIPDTSAQKDIVTKYVIAHSKTFYTTNISLHLNRTQIKEHIKSKSLRVIYVVQMILKTLTFNLIFSGVIVRVLYEAD